MYVVVNVEGPKAGVERFVASVSSARSPLVGSRVSRRWTHAAIEDPRLELVAESSGRRAPPYRARYSFGSRGSGGGPGEHFRAASRRHPKLCFVVCWLYPDPGCGEIGREEFVGGDRVRETLCPLEGNDKRFEELAREWLDWELPAGYPQGE